MIFTLQTSLDRYTVYMLLTWLGFHSVLRFQWDGGRWQDHVLLALTLSAEVR